MARAVMAGNFVGILRLGLQRQILRQLDPTKDATFAGIATDAALDGGSGGDMVTVEQAIAIEAH